MVILYTLYEHSYIDIKELDDLKDVYKRQNHMFTSFAISKALITA